MGVGRIAPDEERLVLSKPFVKFSFTYGVSRGLLYACSNDQYEKMHDLCKFLKCLMAFNLHIDHVKFHCVTYLCNKYMGISRGGQERAMALLKSSEKKYLSLNV